MFPTGGGVNVKDCTPLHCVNVIEYKNKKEEYNYNYLPLDKNYKNKIFERLINNYSNELKYFDKFDLKKKKINKGLEAQKELIKIKLQKQ